MKTETFGGLSVRLCGGSDGDGGGDGPLVVLLHGFGAPGDDLVPLWRVIDAPKETRFAFPAAPIALSSMGFMGDSRAWWEIDMVRLQMDLMSGNLERLARETPDGIAEARAKVLSMLDALTTLLSVPPERVVLGGFSQGAMLSTDVALHTHRPFAGLVLLSGTVVSSGEWLPRMPARAGLPVFESHGTHDPILPFVGAERLRDALTSAGLPVEFHAFRGQHEIPQPVLTKLSAWLRARLG
jgi:phospholipase/carboxylesterase